MSAVLASTAMTKLALIAATMEELARLVLLESRDGEEDAWSAAVDPPDEASEAQLGYLAAKLRRTHPTTPRVWRMPPLSRPHRPRVTRCPGVPGTCPG